MSGNLLYLEEIEMKETLLKLSAKLQTMKLQTLMLREEGQDLIEYALVVALIAFAATAAMHTLAGDINTIFVNIGTALSGETVAG
jgi:pilus assembly protein Flp/PilA